MEAAVKEKKARSYATAGQTRVIRAPMAGSGPSEAAVVAFACFRLEILDLRRGKARGGWVTALL